MSDDFHGDFRGVYVCIELSPRSSPNETATCTSTSGLSLSLSSDESVCQMALRRKRKEREREPRPFVIAFVRERDGTRSCIILILSTCSIGGKQALTAHLMGHLLTFENLVNLAGTIGKL